MIEALKNIEIKVCASGQNVNNLRFADDIDLIAGSTEDFP